MELLISVCVSISSLSKMPQVPEVQLFAAYFPQWHQTPLNDYWFGPNFTDWSHLCNRVRANGGLNRFGRKTLLPLPPPEGLGWYDLNDQKASSAREGIWHPRLCVLPLLVHKACRMGTI